MYNCQGKNGNVTLESSLVLSIKMKITYSVDSTPKNNPREIFDLYKGKFVHKHLPQNYLQFLK
jgi:hypothetical protein